jgi:hypothetical protein
MRFKAIKSLINSDNQEKQHGQERSTNREGGKSCLCLSPISMDFVQFFTGKMITVTVLNLGGGGDIANRHLYHRPLKNSNSCMPIALSKAFDMYIELTNALKGKEGAKVGSVPCLNTMESAPLQC